MPVLSSVIRLLASVVLAVGVNVAVQVMPPSPELTALKVPFAIVKSALANPVTASLKVMVTSEVSPTIKALSATTIVAVGRDVSIVKLPELVVPLPGVDVATLLTPVMLTVNTFVASVILAVGVKVAVQVVPPSPELTALSEPFGIVISALVKPVTAVENVKVTVEVSPALSAESDKLTLLSVGVTAGGVLTAPWMVKLLNSNLATSAAWVQFVLQSK